MSTITKERLQRLIRAIDSGSYDEEEIVGWVNSDEIMELARIALASLKAEPVAMRWRYLADGIYEAGEWNYRNQNHIDELNSHSISRQCELLYAAPQPLTTSERAELENNNQLLSYLYHAQEKRLFKLAQRIKGPAFDKYAHSTSQAIDVLESAVFGESEDACRAAMQSGAVKDRWVACSERMPETMVSVLVTGEWFNYAIAFWDGRGWCDLDYEPPVTQWQPLPAAPQQEVNP